MAAPRKFIAGAVCPQCDKMDKLYIEDDRSVAYCAACGYTMTQSVADDTAGKAKKPSGQAVTLVNFPNKKDS